MTVQAPVSRTEAEAMLSGVDLLQIGQRADAARRARHGGRATFVTVHEVQATDEASEALQIPDAAREVRLLGRPASIEAAAAAVARAKAAAGDRAVTGFDLSDVMTIAAADGVSLSDAAARLAAAGLESIAEVPIDALSDPSRAVGELTSAGLGAWRVVVRTARWEDRIALIERVCEVQRATGAVKAFAPLPRVDDRAAPSTGFDDVRTVAIARLMCATVPHIQVDWPLYGPKLAQVALTYGADDIDGVSVVVPDGQEKLGWRRAPVEDVERNIKAAGLEPVARSGRFA